MELIQSFLNLVAPPITFVSLGFLLPAFVFFKYFLSFVRTVFSEDITGKVVLITGASSGIGEHLAYEYANRGAQLALVDRRETPLEEVANTARYYGSPDVITIPADISNLQDCRRIIDVTINHFGQRKHNQSTFQSKHITIGFLDTFTSILCSIAVDHLVNNAGIANMTLFEEIKDITSFNQIMDTNYWGSVYTTRFAIPYLRNSRGKIIVLSSTAAWLSAPRMSVYNATKAALRSMFETLRVELAPEIGITIVTPGFVESELTKGKALYSQGTIEVHQDVRDALIGAIPVETVEACAKAIVRSACRGDRYLTEPSWYNGLYYLKVFCPEVLEWCYRIFVYTRPGTSAAEAPSKKTVDITGAKNVMYPPSIHSAEIEDD
ncbi:11-beta-hydroxysteroid dehydrogenase A-like isoform X1 [Benincasa hispida]|uniref:11-beta-hydroxysteroid dehydrogenase A-like isoform X1 n=1 Tax=Benincasa hispida TaxID=102211 RepID=UPI001900C0D2|nr:11-beta-hydroxysteroid dehydrogenase A-like isoform X1 [Benincasa hispida]